MAKTATAVTVSTLVAVTDSIHERLIPEIAEAKERAEEAAEDLLARTNADSFDAVVILGAGWDTAADSLGEAETEIDTAQLAGFAPPTVPGQSRTARTMWVGAKRVLVFLGHTALYEGYGPMAVAHPVRTAIAAGARAAILTNAAESLRVDYSVGQPVLLSDHINLTGTSPLQGATFVDLSAAYSPRMRAAAHEADRSLAEGVYAAIRGPNFETPAEMRMLRTIGADLVGMSTTLETIAAVDMGAEVLGLSLVTNEAAGLAGRPQTMERAAEVGRAHAPRLGELLNRILLRL